MHGDTTIELDVDNGVDPLEREIFRYTAASISEELEVNITRTAYSPLIQEAQDYCVSLITPDFKPFIQSEASIPIFVTDMGEPVRDCVEVIGIDNLAPGDVMVTNYNSGQHINNTVMATPLFHGERITAYLAIRAHWADLGGLVVGGQTMSARNILQEGTRYRGIRLMRGGKLQPEVLATIQANTYQIEALTGDLMAQLGACVLGARRWNERVVPRWSADQVDALLTAQISASEALARREIAALPDGVYEDRRRWQFQFGGEDVDLHFHMKVIVEGERMICDMSGMPPQSRLPMNAGAKGGGMAAVRLAFRYLVGGNAPTDGGFFAPLEIILPEGTIVSAAGDAPMGFWNMTIPLMIDMFIAAIGNSQPDLVPASHFASMGGLLFTGRRPDGSLWRMVDGSVGGLGADKHGNGYGPVKCLMLGDMKGIPIEMAEGRFPMRYHSLTLDRDAGGTGLHRGGPASSKTIELTADALFDTYPDPNSPAPGIAGGKPGRVGRVEIKLPHTDDWSKPTGSSTDMGALPAGTMIRQSSPGGGGWGKPADL